MLREKTNQNVTYYVSVERALVCNVYRILRDVTVRKYAHVACLINRKLSRLAVTILAVTLFFNRFTSKFYYVFLFKYSLNSYIIYRERCVIERICLR